MPMENLPLISIIVSDAKNVENIQPQSVEYEIINAADQSGETLSDKFNASVEAAKGRYVMFLSEDTILLENSLSKLCSVAKQFDAEMVHATGYLVPDDNGKFSVDGRSMRRVWDTNVNTPPPRLLNKNIQVRMKFFTSGPMNFQLSTHLFDRNFILNNEIKFQNDLGNSAGILFIFRSMCKAERYAQLHIIASALMNPPNPSITLAIDDMFACIKLLDDEWLRDRFLELYTSNYIIPFYSDNTRECIIDENIKRELEAALKKHFLENPDIIINYFNNLSFRIWRDDGQKKRDKGYTVSLRGFVERSKVPYMEMIAQVSRKYRQYFDCDMDWENPKKFSEKINVQKLHMTKMKNMLTDKVAARDWVKEQIGEQYLMPLIGVYNSFQEIDFDKLPDKFVIKCNHDTHSATLIPDKNSVYIPGLRAKFDYCMAREYSYQTTFPSEYRGIKPKIMIEKYMGDAINDYKFLCFHGKPHYFWVDFDRFTEHRQNIYDMDWNLQPFVHDDSPNTDFEFKRPDNFDEMKTVVKTLCRDFDQVRVDLYNIDGHIYFGEMSFGHRGGIGRIIPEEYDYQIGELWHLEK